MRSFICRFQFAFFVHTKTQFKDVDLKNQLFQLTNTQVQNLKLTCQGIECQDDIVNGLHQNIITNIPMFTSFFAIKSILYFYLLNECNDEELWKQMGNRLIQLFKENQQFYHPICLGQLAYIFGQLKRKNYIQNQQENQVYKQCSNILLERIPYCLASQPPQNITHTIALINLYQLESENVKKAIDALISIPDFSKFNIFDIHFILWSIQGGFQEQLVEFSVLFLENQIILKRIKSDFHKLKQEQQARVLRAFLLLRFNDKECIDAIVRDLKIFKIPLLLSLMVNYFKYPIHQLNNLQTIQSALKEQFDEYYLMEDKDFQDTILGIKLILYFSSQINVDTSQQFQKQIQEYQNFIINNLEHFNNESLMDVINMLNLFDQEKVILEKIQDKIQHFNMDLVDSISFLFCIVKYSNQFHQQINDCLTAIINIYAHEIPNLNIQKNLEFYIALQLLEDQFPLTKALQPYQDEQKIQTKLIETIKKDQTEKYLQNFQFKRKSNNFQGFMENNFEYNLFLLEKQGLLKYIKASRVGCYLVDYRIWDVNLEKLNISELKQMQKSNVLQKEFLEIRQNKYDIVEMDRKNEQSNYFIEIDGAYDFNIRFDFVIQTLYKKKMFEKYKINFKSIALNENQGINDSLQKILDIFGKQ